MLSPYQVARDKHEGIIRLIEDAAEELQDAIRQAREALWAAAVTSRPEEDYLAVRDAMACRVATALAELRRERGAAHEKP